MHENVRGIHSMNADSVRRLTQIGVALSAEKNIDRLLEMILTQARVLTHADAGTLYLVSDDDARLQFALVQNDTLNLNMGGAGSEMTWPPVSLSGADGQPNHANVSAHVAITGQAINIPDVYHAQGFSFEGTKSFDAQTGYQSNSMLVVPLRNHVNDIIGVVQLLNAKNPGTNETVAFSEESEALALSLASQAAVALTNNRLIADLENLLDAFIQTIATTIDEKSPYTGGHIRRVAGLTMIIADKINAEQTGPFASVYLSDDELKELHMAAWLHDIGKIATPEHIVDKATRLEKVCDRIELVKTRFELLKREYQLAMNSTQKRHEGIQPADVARELQELDDDYQLLARLNSGSEWTTDDMIDRIQTIALKKWSADDEFLPLLTEDEIANLSIRRGTLNDEERLLINNHAAVTHKMLSRLPFPKKLRKIADYAAAHHEKLDGSGYPLGLKGDDLPLQARIIALADIFEALTAKDRPYKRGNTLSEATTIMKQMVKEQYIDQDLFDLFMKEKIYLEYARNELSLQQIDF